MGSVKSLLSIDPGTRTGWAEFANGRLVACGTTASPDFHPGPRPDRVVIERPTVYPHSQVPPNDIVSLAITAGRLSHALGEVEWILPRQWKGQVPKPKSRRVADYIIHRRVLARLDDAEAVIYLGGISAVPPTCCDLTDAVGLGLWALGRLER